MKKNIFHFALLLSLTFFAGCSNRTAVTPNLALATHSNVKLPYTVAVDASRLKDLSIRGKYDVSDVTIDFGNALILSIKNQLENNFQKVYLLEADQKIDNYDYKFVLKNYTKKSAYDNFTSTNNIIAYDNKDNEIFRKDVNASFRYELPMGLVGMTVVGTVFTLGIASPITLPHEADSIGLDLSLAFSSFNDKISVAIADTLADANLYPTTYSIAAKPNQNQQIQEDKLQKDVDKFIAAKDLNGLKEYTDKNPNAVYYIKDDWIRLAMTGPKGLKVGDIREYLKKGKSEPILLSMIKQQDVPYKRFSLSEIDMLTEMGLSDKVIVAMIDVTTKLMNDEKLRKQQEFYLAEEKKIAATKQPKVIYQNTSNQGVQQQSNQVVDKVQDEVIKQGVGMLLDQLFR